jgi:hypothetical protein
LCINGDPGKAYEEKIEACGNHSGYSTTDRDACPMRTKECREDLRPAYNGINSSGAYIFADQKKLKPNLP